MEMNRRALNSKRTISYTKWQSTGRFEDNVWFELNFSRRTSVKIVRGGDSRARRQETITSNIARVFILRVVLASAYDRQEYLCAVPSRLTPRRSVNERTSNYTYSILKRKPKLKNYFTKYFLTLCLCKKYRFIFNRIRILTFSSINVFTLL